MKYRKKPVVIEAHQLLPDNLEQLERWCKGSIKGTKLPRNERCIDIQTFEGEMRVHMFDWIIKGIKGEYYPCKPDIFEGSYDLIDE